MKFYNFKSDYIKFLQIFIKFMNKMKQNIINQALDKFSRVWKQLPVQNLSFQFVCFFG